MAEQTIFDKILAGEIPSTKAYEDDDVYAFHDIEPQAPVHVLVIPKRKRANVTEFAEADAEEAGRFLAGVARVAKHLELQHGYRVVMNTGPDALQSVEYVHAHIIAGRKLSWPPG